MEETERPSPPPFKLKGVSAVGEAQARPALKQLTPEQLHHVNTAIDILTQGAQLHPVRLSSGISLNIPPSSQIELRGKVMGATADIDILPRSKEWLPEGLEVVKADLNVCEGITEPLVTITIANRSSTARTVTSRDVLAELQHSGSVKEKVGLTDFPLEALVGPCCESMGWLNDINMSCLIDSGSQVTVVTESFHRQYLSNLPLEQLDTALNITGAGGQTVPYLGVIRVRLRLPEEVAGTSAEVDTLAVVCPDTKFSAKVPVIVGTNTLRGFAKFCQQKAGRGWNASLSIRCEVAFAYREAAHPVSGRLCPVRLLGHDTVVPPNSAVDVRGVTRKGITTNRDTVLVQEPTLENLPEGLTILSSKIPTRALPRVKVTVVNHTDSPIIIKRRQVIADLFSIQAEYVISNVIQELNTHETEVVNINPSEKTLTVTAEQKSELKNRLRFGENANPTWKASFTEKLLSYADVFAQADLDVGKTDVAHDIELMPGSVTRDRPRPIPPQDLEEVRQHIQSLLDAEIIKPSTSPYASPIVLVRKKNGALRMCVDYRKINARTVRDSYALPKIEDLFLTLSGSKFFTTVDLSKAYYQVPLTERAKKISAFTTPFGLYEFERLPFGLVNAPMTFQRLMECCFSDMNLAELIIFLDDVLVHASTLQELEERTIKVLDRMRRFKLKLDPDKCMFGATEVRHLGYLISEGSIRPDPEKVETVKTWPIPTTVKEVKSFLGFAGFYRRFIANFSALAKPLNDLTVGYIPRKCQTKGKKKPQLNLSSDITHLWGEKQQAAFEAIIQALTSEPVLGIADKTKPFVLHCDASGTGLGAVLYQEHGGQLKVIAYASRGLNKSEQNYPAHKREFLALKWAMSDKFSDYLLGSSVTVVTDNNPLCYVLKNAKLDATSHRWLSSLSVFDFQLKYKKGSTHTDADALSRRPQASPEEDEEYKQTMDRIAFLVDKAQAFETTSCQDKMLTVNQNSVQAIFQAHKVIQTASVFQQTVTTGRDSCNSDRLKENITPGEVTPAVEQLINDPSRLQEDILDPPQSDPDSVTPVDWRQLQTADRTLKIVIDHLERGETLDAKTLKGMSADLRVFMREQTKLVLRNGVLFRKVQEEDQVRLQLVIPSAQRKEALKGIHEDLFHTSFQNAIQQARMRFYWPFMARDLEKKIKKCSRCIRRGATSQTAPMQSIVTTSPLELLSIDFLTIDVKGQKQNILVVMDHFTKFGTTILTKDQTAKTVARALWQNFFMIYGFPKRILSDQGRDFESKLIKELCEMAGIKKCRTTPYHPAGNPVERWNRTLIHMLRSLEDDKKVDWRKSLPSVVHAYNCCIHQSTGFCPYYLFFGRQPRLPVDIAFGIDLDHKKMTPRQYVKTMKEQLQKAYELARNAMAKSASRNKMRYDASAHAAELEVGDRVLVKRLGPRLESKITDKWERDIYTVLAKSPDLPVYTVQDESGQGPRRTLHRNQLLPIGALDTEETQEERQYSLKPNRRVKDNTTGPPVFTTEEEEEDLTQPYITVSVEPSCDTRLRVSAPEFIPRPFSNQDTENASSDVTNEEEERETNLVESTEAEESTRTDDATEEEAKAEGEETEDEARDQPQPLRRSYRRPKPVGQLENEVLDQHQPLRRSNRIRKPVDRLNLLHYTEIFV